MKTNRRSFLSGLIGAAVAGSSEPTPQYATRYWGGPLEQPNRVRATERIAYGFIDRRLIDPQILRLSAALDGPDDYALVMTDWGGAL